MDSSSRACVYDFEDEVEVNSERGDSDDEDDSMLANYEKTKRHMGFKWWSIREEDNGTIIVTLDGRPIDQFLKEKDVSTVLGGIKSVALKSHLLMEVQFDVEQIILGLFDFQKEASGFARTMPDTTKKEEFINYLQNKLKSKETAQQSPESTIGGNDIFTDSEQNQGQEKNDFIRSAKGKRIGTFEVNVRNMTFCHHKYSIRPIDPCHAQDIKEKLRSVYLNGGEPCLPFATGIVKTDVTEQDLSKGDTTVEIIDGNHSLTALKELNDEFPEVECFKRRKVVIYKNLNQAEILTISLLANEMSGTVKQTRPFDLLLVMRKVLQESFSNILSTDFQEHIYKLFNAVCPENPKEQTNRRKNLQSLIRLSTMNKQVFDLVLELQKKKPGHSPYVYRELGNLRVDQACRILKEVLAEKKLKLPTIAKKAKETIAKDPPAEGDELSFQRIRQGISRKKVKASSKKKTPSETVDDGDMTCIIGDNEDETPSETVDDGDMTCIIGDNEDETYQEPCSQDEGILESRQESRRHNTLSDENEELKAINKSLRKRIEALSTENEDLKAMHKGVQLKLKASESEYQKIKVEMEVLKTQNESLLKENYALKEDILPSPSSGSRTWTQKHDFGGRKDGQGKQISQDDLTVNQTKGKVKAITVSQGEIVQNRSKSETNKRTIKPTIREDFISEPSKKKNRTDKGDQALNTIKEKDVSISSEPPNKQSSLPFPVPGCSAVQSDQKDSHSITSNKEEKKKMVHVAEWNGKAYVSVQQGKDMLVFCKKPIGKIEDETFHPLPINDSMFTLDKKDVQELDYNFILCSLLCQITSDKVNLNYEEIVKFIYSNLDYYLDANRSPVH